MRNKGGWDAQVAGGIASVGSNLRSGVRIEWLGNLVLRASVSTLSTHTEGWCEEEY